MKQNAEVEEKVSIGFIRERLAGMTVVNTTAKKEWFTPEFLNALLHNGVNHGSPSEVSDGS